MKSAIKKIQCRKFAVLFALSLVCLFAARPSRADLTAGAAKIDITPYAMAVPLGGYAARRGAPSTGVHDPVFARAITLSDGDTRFCLVSVDLCFAPANLKAEVVKRVAAAGVVGMDAAHLLLCATHTHCGPDPLAMHSGNNFPELKNWTHFNADLLDFTADKIADAVRLSVAGQVPAMIGFRQVNLSRRHLNRNRRGDKIVDPEMTALKITTTDGKPLAALFDFAAHPTLYNEKMMQISADWPGVATAAVERELGNNAVCLFLNGDEGDAATEGATGDTEEERAANYGETIGRTALDSIKRIKMQNRAALSAWTQNVTLPPRQPNPLFLVAAGQLGASFGQAQALVTGLMPTETALSFAKIGDLVLIGFPCEPTGEIGLAAKNIARRAGRKTVAIVALTNDWIAYCVTPAQYRAGKYEASMSFYGPTLGSAMLNAVKSGIEK